MGKQRCSPRLGTVQWNCPFLERKITSISLSSAPSYHEHQVSLHWDVEIDSKLDSPCLSSTIRHSLKDIKNWRAKFFPKKELSHLYSIYTVWQDPKYFYSICGQLRSLPKILFTQTTSYRFRFLKNKRDKSVNLLAPTLPYLNARAQADPNLRLTRAYFRRDGAPVCSLKVLMVC